jgi:hypothetical protein
MTPEAIEARFERIEAILALTVEQNADRDRQNQLMSSALDRLIESNSQFDAWKVATEKQMQLMSTALNKLIESNSQFSNWKVATEEQNADRDEQMQLMSLGINRLLESSTEYRRWKVETDQRFNILLEEVRSVNRRVSSLENS